MFIPTWGNDPIWRINFQMGWNHHLGRFSIYTLQETNISHLGKKENHRLKGTGTCRGYVSSLQVAGLHDLPMIQCSWNFLKVCIDQIRWEYLRFNLKFPWCVQTHENLYQIVSMFDEEKPENPCILVYNYEFLSCNCEIPPWNVVIELRNGCRCPFYGRILQKWPNIPRKSSWNMISNPG